MMNELFEKALELKKDGKLAEALNIYEKNIFVLFGQLESNRKSELELQRLLSLNELLGSVILERYKVLPLISTLSAALTGFIILNSQSVQIKWLALAAFIIMLLLMPLSVALLLHRLEQDAAHIANKMKESFTENRPESSPTGIDANPWILWLFFFMAIVFLIISFF